MSKVISISEGDLKIMVNKVINEVTKQRTALNEDADKRYMAIGFTTKFYTLWSITETIERDEGGVYKKTFCHYHKNISMDLERAKEKYPEAVYIPSLRGHTSFWHTECLERHGDDKFKSGKYFGQKIADCKDYDYLLQVWRDSRVVPSASREMAASMLEKAGYKRINDMVIVTPQEYARIEATFSECEETAAKFKKGPVTVLFTYNLDEYGNYEDGNITYHFPNIQHMSYRGYYYSLPVDANGNAKRIKGKELTLIADDCELDTSNKYGWGAYLTVNVKDFLIN